MALISYPARALRVPAPVPRVDRVEGAGGGRPIRPSREAAGKRPLSFFPEYLYADGPCHNWHPLALWQAYVGGRGVLNPGIKGRASLDPVVDRLREIRVAAWFSLYV